MQKLFLIALVISRKALKQAKNASQTAELIHTAVLYAVKRRRKIPARTLADETENARKKDR
jgi:hypothetical protein